MTAPGEGERIADNPAPEETVLRTAAKRVLGRLLPQGAYQRLLAWSKSRDFASGRFREPELDLLDSLVGEGDVVVDVGANHGMWTLALSRAVGEDGRVYSFEPVPFTFGVLKGVVRRAGLANATLLNRGCSDQAAMVKMTVPLQSSGASDDLQAHLAQRDTQADAGPSVEVTCEMTTLDSVFAETTGISLVKLDIEGAEPLALRGGAATIARERPAIVCEVDAGFLAGFGQRPEDVVEYLAQWGYEPYVYGGDGELERVGDPARIDHANVVFLTAERRQRQAGR